MNKPLTLLACHRPVLHPDHYGGESPVQHCYAKVVDHAGQMFDSISYDGPTGVSEATDTRQLATHCEAISNVTVQEWDAFKKQVHQQCQATNFSLADNNCCSCLGKVFENKMGIYPNNVQQAEMQIELQRPHVLIGHK